ncbi:MAG: SGNH/GDSL hydrolase family protein [Vicinamibacterales bacterium]
MSDAAAASASCSFGVRVSVVPTIPSTAFLAFGDSVTAGEVTVPLAAQDAFGFPVFSLRLVPSASYPTVLTTLLRDRYKTQAASLLVQNAGVSGETAADGATRFPSTFLASRTQVVLLLEGYNGLTAAGTAAYCAEASAIESMAREARLRGAGVFIGALTPSKPGGRNTIPTSTITGFNARLQTVAAGQGATYVDLYQALLPNVDAYIGVDGLHPTELGYDAIARTFLAAIVGRLENPPGTPTAQRLPVGPTVTP